MSEFTADKFQIKCITNMSDLTNKWYMLIETNILLQITEQTYQT